MLRLKASATMGGAIARLRILNGSCHIKIMNVFQRRAPDIRSAIQFWRKNGLWATAKIIVRRPLVWFWSYSDSRFDRKWGVDTSGRIQLDWLEISSESKADGHLYEPVGIQCLRTVLDQIDTNRYSIFVDYGSGKGRALLIASDYSFRQIIGVEFSSELHEIAQSNIKHYSNPKQRCSEIESVCVDAVEFDPPTEPSVLFFFSPFQNQVMQRVLDRIRTSSSQHETDVAIAFVGSNPKTIEILKAMGWDRQYVGSEWNYQRSTIHQILIFRRNPKNPV
jgi:tRNA G46 methylase TrmB